MSRVTTGPGGALNMEVIELGNTRVWVIPVEADPTGSVTPSQAPVIAVLATNPPPGSVGCWYNAGTSSATWRPLISASTPTVIPDNLLRLAAAEDAQLCDELIGLGGTLGPASLNQKTAHALSAAIGKLIYGQSRFWMLMCGDPAAVADGVTIEIPWRDSGTGNDKEIIFCLDRSGTFVAPEGQIRIDISACANANEFAVAVYAALDANLDLGIGRGSSQPPGSPVMIVATSFSDQNLNDSSWNPHGTAISSGFIGLSATAGPPATDGFEQIWPYLRELSIGAQQSFPVVTELDNNANPPVSGGATPAANFYGREYPAGYVGQIQKSADGRKAWRRTLGQADDPDNKCWVPLHRTKTYRGTPENVGTLLGYFDSPLLHAVKARRDVRLRWVILGVNTAAEAKHINLGLRVRKTGDVTNFTMAKAIHTMGTPSEGPVVLHQNMAGLDYAGNGEFPLLLDFNLPIQSLGSGGDGIAAGGSFGVTLEMVLRIPHQLTVENYSGLGTLADMKRDLQFFRLEWDAWYRDADNLNPTPLAHAHGEAQIYDTVGAGVLQEIERLGIQTKSPSPEFWGQVSAIDPGSYVEIEYL